jgi:hypothetical protein
MRIVENTTGTNLPDGYMPVRNPRTGSVLFRYDPLRELIEIQERGIKVVIELDRIRRNRNR